MTTERARPQGGKRPPPRLTLADRTALKDYHDAPHFEIDDDGRPMLEVIVPEALRGKAAEALAKAEKMLKDEGRGQG